MPTIYENKLLLPTKWISISVKCHIWSMAVYGAKTWTLQKRDQKYRESFETWCWRMMEISWTDRVKHGGVLHIQPRRKETSYIQ
jgi:hypothetical protein